MNNSNDFFESAPSEKTELKDLIEFLQNKESYYKFDTIPQLPQCIKTEVLLDLAKSFINHEGLRVIPVIDCNSKNNRMKRVPFPTHVEGQSEDVKIPDIGSGIGYVFSFLPGLDQKTAIPPQLIVYGSVLRLLAKGIDTVCVMYKTNNLFFGSTMTGTGEVKSRALSLRHQILSSALGKRGITLPAVPPVTQNLVVTHIEKVYIPRVFPTSNISTAGFETLYIRLARAAILEMDLTAQPTKCIFRTNHDNFRSILKDIWRKIMDSDPEDSLVVWEEQNCEDILGGGGTQLDRSYGQQYGHCAETYTLTYFLLKEEKFEHVDQYEGIARATNPKARCKPCAQDNKLDQCPKCPFKPLCVNCATLITKLGPLPQFDAYLEGLGIICPKPEPYLIWDWEANDTGDGGLVMGGQV